MRRAASALVLGALLTLSQTHGMASAADDCRFDPGANRLICNPSGGEGTPAGPRGEPPSPSDDDPGRRYVYTATDPVIGDCYYWSDVPGGLDAWDPGNDPAVIAITTTLPLCPAPIAIDPFDRAWDVLRSWDLDPPSPTITPPDAGITGLPSHIAALPAADLTHSEVLPDGRLLQVRARVTSLIVDWGDGTSSDHRPDTASGYPDGSASHVYRLKTCTDQYRSEHPSGGLCHPVLDVYTLDVSWVWTGEFDVGLGWTPLGALTRSTQVLYEVDEVRGVNVP